LIYDLSNIVSQTDAKIRLRELIALEKKIEIKRLSNSRSGQQNRALHLLFKIISDQLSEMGLEFRFSGLNVGTICTPYTDAIVKEFVWRPIQVAMFDIKSTRDINTSQINEIVEVIAKFFAERGVVIEFPSIQTLINKNR